MAARPTQGQITRLMLGNLYESKLALFATNDIVNLSSEPIRITTKDNSMESSALITIGLPISLFIIMVGMGLTLRLQDFKGAALAAWPLTFGTLMQVAALPIFAYCLAALLSLSPAMTVGLVLIAACPGGTTSNLFAFLGRGDVALSILLTVIASLVTIITLPFFVSYTMGAVLDASAMIELPVLRTIATLILIVLLPVMIGMVLRVKFPTLAEKAESGMSVFGFLVLMAVIIAIAVDAGSEIIPMLKEAGLAAALLNLGGIILGLAGGRLLGLTPAQAFTVAVELGIKNGALGVTVALTLLENTQMSVAAAVYSVFMFGFGLLMIAYGRLTIRP